jgi:hypothetical protein
MLAVAAATIHDLRRTGSTLPNDTGFNPDWNCMSQAARG